MSALRKNVPIETGELAAERQHDMKAYEVFIQLDRTKPLSYAGGLDAPDLEMALRFAREHYGRDQPCYRVWVVPREAIATACQEQEVIWRLSDQSYRQAKGYDVAGKWQAFRTKRDYDEYRKEDLKDAF